MMKRAGFVQMSGQRALDEEGIPCDVVEVSIRGEKFGIRISDIRRCLQGTAAARIERIRRNWTLYLDGLAGLARVSRSGRAINIDLVSGDRFTVSRDSLVAVITRKGRYAPVAEIPSPSPALTSALFGGDSMQGLFPGGQRPLPGVV